MILRVYITGLQYLSSCCILNDLASWLFFHQVKPSLSSDHLPLLPALLPQDYNGWSTLSSGLYSSLNRTAEGIGLYCDR